MLSLPLLQRHLVNYKDICLVQYQDAFVNLPPPYIQYVHNCLKFMPLITLMLVHRRYEECTPPPNARVSK